MSARAAQLALFDAPPAPESTRRPCAPVPLGEDDPAAIALEIVTELRAAESALAGVATELAGPHWSDRIVDTMKRQIARAGVAYRDDALGRAFRAELADNPEGSFAESGTMVRTVMVRLTKRTA